MFDTINGMFELVGSALTWMSVYRVWKDKGYAGVYAPAVVLFFVWGFWNLFFYPHLGQWMSFLGGVSLVVANLFWVLFMFYYGKKL